MAFLRVVEVLPPRFRRSRADLATAATKMEEFTAQVSAVRGSADVFLVANAKDQSMLKIDAVHAAAELQRELGVAAAPVLVVRDQNRPQLLSSVLTALSAGLDSVMVAWGDEYPDGDASNVRDFRTLAGAIAEAAKLRGMMRSKSRIFAPVNIEGLSGPKGASLAQSRIAAGADLLLAQPPTTDAEAFERHLALLDGTGLRGRVLLNVFPFKGSNDMARYESLFGWKLPKSLHDAARGGEGRLLELERAVVRRIRREKLPGVYLSTRGEVGLAKKILS